MQNSTNNNDGMPKIAEQIRNNKVHIIIILCTVMLIVIGYYFLKTKAVKEAGLALEESYTLKNDIAPIQAPVLDNANNVDDSNKNTEPMSKELIAAQVALVQERQQQIQKRLSAPMMLVNNNVRDSAEASNSDTQNKDTGALSQKETPTATAVAIGSLGSIVAAGNFIHAILEPATNSDLPGSLRAIVSEPVYAEDGSQILIPRGSRLIGEYKSGMTQGQSRIFVVWQRLLTPDGISVQLVSNGVDSLGVAGIEADSIDRHFWERFSTASLLSIIGAGTASVGVSGSDQENSASAYRTAIANSFSQSANDSLQQQEMIPPTLRTVQGKPIMVFIAKDLQFDAAIKTVKPSVNIF